VCAWKVSLHISIFLHVCVTWLTVWAAGDPVSSSAGYWPVQEEPRSRCRHLKVKGQTQDDTCLSITVFLHKSHWNFQSDHITHWKLCCLASSPHIETFSSKDAFTRGVKYHEILYLVFWVNKSQWSANRVNPNRIKIISLTRLADHFAFLSNSSLNCDLLTQIS